MLRFIQKGMLILFTNICFLFSGMSAFAQYMQCDFHEVLKLLSLMGDIKAVYL